MNAVTASRASDAERQWFIAGRWQEFEGEARANLLRIIAIAAFYAVQLATYHGLHLGFLQIPRSEPVDARFHQAVTVLAGVWTLLALGVALCLRLRLFPGSMKFLSCGVDLVLLTWVLLLADGPRSPLIVGFFVILCMAALRFSLALLWFATAGSLLGYLVLLAHARWWNTRDLRVPRYQEIIFLLALVLCGIVLGQVLRQVRKVADDYADRLHRSPGGRP